MFLRSIQKMYYKILNITVKTENLITTSGISGTVPILTQFILSKREKENILENGNVTNKNKTIYVQNPGNPSINSIFKDLGVTLKPLHLTKFSVPDVDKFKQEIEHLKSNNLPLPYAI